MTKQDLSPRNFFHCYATANDSFFYIKDLRNLLRIRFIDSGVPQLHLVIAISQCRKSTLGDQIFERLVTSMFRNHPVVKVLEIFTKGNLGRDFSSYAAMLERIRPMAESEDYIFFQNRSGYGPFRKHWYRRLVEQLEKFEDVALCGSTINFRDHPSRSSRNNVPHIQTYSLISKKFYLDMLLGEFPGEKESDRAKIITSGEIGLSQFFLEKNYAITCMEWPEIRVTNQTPPLQDLDVKKLVKAKHCFYHRRYFKFRRLPKLLAISLFQK